MSHDSIIPTKRKPMKIKIGFDLGKYAWAKLYGHQSLDFSADANVYKNYIIRFDFGNENHHTGNSLYDYHTSGNYYRLGLDYNLYDNWPGMDNNITVGFRLGYSDFEHFLHHYTINQSGAISPPKPIIANKKFASLNSTWFELTGGMQVETFKNIYFGMQISAKYLIATTKLSDFSTAYIPGFFSTNSSGLGFGMKYTISYQFSL